MWKRIGIVLLALLATSSIVYAMDKNLHAAAIESPDPQYLPVGTSYKMNDLTWKVAVQNEDGTGFIVSHDWYSKSAYNYDNSVKQLTKYNPNGQSDAIGEKTIEMNDVSTASYLKISDFHVLTKNETDFSMIPQFVGSKANSNSFWIDSEGASSYGYFYGEGSYGSTYSKKFNRVYENNSSKQAIVFANPVFNVDLPILAIQTPTFTTALSDDPLVYGDPMLDANTPFGVLTVVGGEGPFNVTIEAGSSIAGEQTSENEAIPAGTTFSSDFKLHQSTNREYELLTNKKLDAGDHYVKIKVVDTSTNSKIAYDLSDPKHAEKTIILKFHVDKKEQTIEHSSLNPIYLKIGDSAVTHTLTNSNNTDSEFSAGSVSYTYTGGTPNTGFTITPSTSDPLSYSISVASSYTGSSLPATFHVKATAAATKNFKEIATINDRDVIVYKDLSELIWTSAMPGGFGTTDVDTIGTTVGTLQAKDGVGPYYYEMTSPADGEHYDSDAAANNLDFEITGSPSSNAVNVVTKSVLPNGTYTMQFKVHDSSLPRKTIYKSAQIVVSAQAQTALHFKTEAGGTILDAIGKEIYVGDKNERLYAEGGTTGNTIRYELVNPSDSTYLVVASGGGLTPKLAGNIRVKATMPGNSQYGDVSVEMEVRILPGKQTIAFSDPADKNVMIDSASFPNPAIAAKQSDGTAGVGTITYESSNSSIASVDPTTGVITPGSITGTTTIKATIHDADGNYADASCTKKIKTFSGMNTTWTATSPNAKANAIIANTTIAGRLSVTGNNGNPTFSIEKSYEDGALFDLVSVGTSTQVKWNTTVSAADLVAHGESYTLRIKIVDNNQAPQYEDITIQVDPAENAIDFMDGIDKITKITKTYGEDTSFLLQAVSLNGGAITFDIASGANQDVVTLSGTGGDTATIQKAGTTTIKASVVAGAGYGALESTIEVTIEKGSQEIIFDDTTENVVFVKDGSFFATATLYETSAKVVSTRLLQYSSDTPTICSVDAAGKVKMLQEGNCTIRAENKDTNFESTSKTRTINLYTGMGVSFSQTHTPQAETASGRRDSAVGELHISGGNGSYTYALGTGNDPANADISYFKISSTGIISLDKDLSASDLASKYDGNKKAYVLHAQFIVRDGLQNTKTISCDIEIKGAPLQASFDTAGGDKITHVFAEAPGNTFSVNMASNKGNGTPVYSFKSGPSDVLTIDGSGRISMLNASQATDAPVEIQAVIPASNGYDEETISCEVEITKAEQSDFKFQSSTIRMQTSAALDPVVNGIMSKQADGSLNSYTLTSTNASIIAVNGTTISSNTTMAPAPGVEIKAMVPGDRNYKSAIASAFVIVDDTPAYNFAISVPSATYGDQGLIATVPIDDGIGTKTRVWTSSDPTVATIDNDGNITILHAGTTTITCVQSTPTQPDVRDSGVLVVGKRSITFAIDDKEMHAGETVPTFTSVLSAGTLVGNDPLPVLSLSCLKQGKPITSQSEAGSYTISGTVDATQYPDYSIQIVEGTLIILQDTSSDAWYHLETHSDSTLISDTSKWYKDTIDVVLDGASVESRIYDEISLDQSLWARDTIPFTQEGESTIQIFIRSSATQALASMQEEVIRIDHSAPIIHSITGEPAERNAIEKILHTLSFGTFFKPSLTVEIQAEDVLPQGVNKNSGIKEIAYTVQEILKNGTLKDTPVKQGVLTPGENFQLVDDGMYLVCAIAHDTAGNSSTELCSGVRIYTRGEDTNGDGIPDINIDIDGDGVPDINITKGEEKIPSTNIDTDGDGIPDYNIDIDDDGIPDVNIGPDISTWKPELCIDIDNDQKKDFCTMEGLEPVLNIDTDKDGYPDINLDLDRDGKPELNVDTTGNRIPNINIDSDGDGKPDVNLAPNGDGVIIDKFADITEWKPQKNVDLGNHTVIYDTMEGIKTRDMLDELVDDPSGIVVTKPNGETFLPNYAIKVDVITDTISSQEKNKVEQLIDEDQEVKEVYDVMLLKDNTKVQPDGSIVVRIPVSDGIDTSNPILAVQQEDGSYKLVNALFKNGYLEYETTYLGKVSLIQPKSDKQDPEAPNPTPSPTTSVQGSYTQVGMGGANTGDATDIGLYFLLFSSTLLLLGGLRKAGVHKK